MTIGYVVKRYPRFSETFVVTEILAREARGADIEIFSLRRTADSRFHDSLSRVRAPVTYLAKADDAAQAVELAAHVVRRGITHLHAHFASSATTVARLAASVAGVTYSFTAHAKDIFHDTVDAADLRTKLADAHHAVTVSDYNVRYLADRFGATAQRVYNGLDLADFQFAPTAADRPPELVAVGRLVEKKGFDVLLDACALLAAKGRDFRCRLVGAGALEDDLRRRVRELRLTDRVELTGPLTQREVRQAVRGAAVLAAPCVVGSDGNTDGLPTVLLEAMALGTPCVSTDLVGIGEAVRDRETGLLVPQRDARALASGIGELLDDRVLRTRLAGAARDLVEENFDSTRQAATLEAMLP